jgi:heme/copper-type cytochrome/quinol oxidase subunit 3
MTLGLHTGHLITDFADSLVLLWFALRGPFDGKRFVDIFENAIYWYFVVASWVAIYLLLYVVPRVL